MQETKIQESFFQISVLECKKNVFYIYTILPKLWLVVAYQLWYSVNIYTWYSIQSSSKYPAKPSNMYIKYINIFIIYFYHPHLFINTSINLQQCGI